MTRIDSPLVVAVLTGVCYAILVFLLLDARGGDISSFVVAGGPGVDPRHVPRGLTVIPNIGGYDGMVFYRLALDPFTHTRAAYGITLDTPAYRQQRIGFPLIVWLLSLGNAAFVPALLVIVNVAALVAIGAFGAAIARQFGEHALWGLIFPLYPGFVLSLSRDTSEIAMAAFALAAIWALGARRHVVAAILLSYAVLTRETALVIAVALAAAAVYDRLRRRQRRLPPLVFLLPLVIYALWQLLLTAWWGMLPLQAGAPAMTLPLVEYARFLAAAAPRHIHQQRLYFAESMFLAALVIFVVLGWRRSRAALEWRLAWLAHLAVAATLPHTIWVEDFGFLRIFADLFLVSAVLIVPTGATARWAMLLMTAGLWYYVGIDVVQIG